MKADRSPLALPTLQHRHFAELELTSRQFHLYASKTGLEDEDREAGKWRLFSPYDVLRLAIIRELKLRCGRALVDQPSLFKFLSVRDFPIKCLKYWQTAAAPVLVTNLEEQHRVLPLSDMRPEELHTALGFYVVLPISTAINHMLTATHRGGSPEQKLRIQQLEENRQRHLVERDGQSSNPLDHASGLLEQVDEVQQQVTYVRTR